MATSFNLAADNTLFITATGLQKINTYNLTGGPFKLTRVDFSNEMQGLGNPNFPGPSSVVYSTDKVSAVPLNEHLLVVRVKLNSETDTFDFNSVSIFSGSTLVGYLTYPYTFNKTPGAAPYSIEFLIERDSISYVIQNTGKQIASVASKAGLPITPSFLTSFLTYVITESYRPNDNNYEVAYIKNGKWAFKYLPLSYPPTAPQSDATESSYYTDTATPSQDRDFYNLSRARSAYGVQVRATFGFPEEKDGERRGYVYLRDEKYEFVELPIATPFVEGLVKLAHPTAYQYAASDAVITKGVLQSILDDNSSIGFNDGTVEDPTITFRNSTDVGFYLPASNSIALAIAGVQQFYADATLAEFRKNLRANQNLEVGGDTNISGNATIAGNLTVAGTTVTVNSTDLYVKDPIITLNEGQTGNGASVLLSGIEIDRGNLISAKWGWIESGGYWSARDASTFIGDVRIKAQDGSQLTPAYTFLNNQDMGMYREGNNQIGVAISGNRRMLMDFGYLNYETAAGNFRTTGAFTYNKPVGSNDGGFVAQSDAGQFAGVYAQDNTTTRWRYGKNSAGDFIIERYNSSGVSQGVALSIANADGKITTINPTTGDNSTQVATTNFVTESIGLAPSRTTIVPNGNFELGSVGWNFMSGGASIIEDGDTGEGKRSLFIFSASGTPAARSLIFPVAQGVTYSGLLRIKAAAALASGFYYRVVYLAANGVTSVGSTDLALDTAVGTGWSYLGGRSTAPAGAFFAYIDIYQTSGSPLIRVDAINFAPSVTSTDLQTSIDLSGVPTAPTAAAGTNTTQIATTAFVAAGLALKANLTTNTFTGNQIAPNFVSSTFVSRGGSAAVSEGGQITLGWGNNQAASILAQGNATWNIDVAGGSANNNFRIFSVDANGTARTALTINGDTGNIEISTAVNFATASTAPTATAGTNTTQLATTAFVTTADNLKANIASPTFTGIPAAPTASLGTNTTQIATTAYIYAFQQGVGLADWDNATLGGFYTAPDTATNSPTNQFYIGLVGQRAGMHNLVLAGNIDGTHQYFRTRNTNVWGAWKRIVTDDRVASLTTTKADLASPSFTGLPTAPTASAIANNSQIATTSYVDGADSRLGAVGKIITDWNSAIYNGYYMGYNITNSPIANWCIGQVVAHNANWITQTVWAFSTNTTSDTQTYRRECNNGVWEPWQRIWQTEAELDARYATLTALAVKANLASPAFTGTPTAPTASTGNSSTQIATTAFVQAAIGAGGTFNPDNYVPKSGGVYTGDVYIQNSGWGGVGLSTLSNNNGYVSIYKPNGQRAGFMGYNVQNRLKLEAENGMLNWDFGQTPTVVNAEIWHDGNLDTKLRDFSYNSTVHGGGIISVPVSNRIKWTQRFINIGNGGASWTDYSMPAVGVVIQCTDGTTVTVDANGIPLEPWASLWYSNPDGAYRIIRHSVGTSFVKRGWVAICHVNGDTNTYYFPRGIRLQPGRSHNTAKGMATTGDNTFDENQWIVKAWPTLVLQKAANNQGNQIQGNNAAGLIRWIMRLGSDENETGGNSGSNFQILRYADDGSYIDGPVSINRANGQINTTVRPYFAGQTPWDSGNFVPGNKADYKYMYGMPYEILNINDLQIVSETKFINPSSTGTPTSSMGYYIGLGGGDNTARGAQGYISHDPGDIPRFSMRVRSGSGWGRWKSIGEGLLITYVASGTALTEAGCTYRCTGGDITLNLPASPGINERVTIIRDGANSLTVGRNGNTITTATTTTEDVVMNVNKRTATFVFTGSTWIVAGGSLA